MSINIEREKVKRKIAALLNKTTDRGATEEEAMSASSKAAELMAFYEIEFGELEFKEKNIVKAEVVNKTYIRRPLILLTSVSIGRLCQVRVWWATGTGKICYLGFKHDVEIAVAMHGFLEESCQRAIEDFVGGDTFNAMIAQGCKKIGIVMSFIKGFDIRMQARIRELALEKESKLSIATGTALVCLKDAEIDNEMRNQGIRLRSKSSACRISARSAYLSGAGAASSVALSSQTGYSSAAKRLG